MKNLKLRVEDYVLAAVMLSVLLVLFRSQDSGQPACGSGPEILHRLDQKAVWQDVDLKVISMSEQYDKTRRNFLVNAKKDSYTESYKQLNKAKDKLPKIKPIARLGDFFSSRKIVRYSDSLISNQFFERPDAKQRSGSEAETIQRLHSICTEALRLSDFLDDPKSSERAQKDLRQLGSMFRSEFAKIDNPLVPESLMLKNMVIHVRPWPQ